MGKPSLSSEALWSSLRGRTAARSRLRMASRHGRQPVRVAVRCEPLPGLAQQSPRNRDDLILRRTLCDGSRRNRRTGTVRRLYRAVIARNRRALPELVECGLTGRLFGRDAPDGLRELTMSLSRCDLVPMGQHDCTRFLQCFSSARLRQEMDLS